VPLSFVALRVLPFAAAGAVIASMTAGVVVAWTFMQRGLDATVVTGPVCVAWLTVLAYRALEREAASRQELVHEGDLAEAQHSAGVLAERARLSREIHDSVAQALSSINLLPQAAERACTSRPLAARDHVDRAVHGSGTRVDVQVDGTPVEVPADVATALLRTARGALANVVEHAAATEAMVSLTYHPDAASLDVRDDGAGFDRRRTTAAEARGRGLPGIRDRAEQFGGTLTVETAPGEGTALAVTIPLGTVDGPR
jgi:signal transduction histidine kinase